MTEQIIKKYFEEDSNDNIIPILYRQVATRITYDEELNIFVDCSREINDVSRQKAYTTEYLKEYLKKYKNYKNYKKISYSIKTFKRIVENKLPSDIILEIIKYL